MANTKTYTVDKFMIVTDMAKGSQSAVFDFTEQAKNHPFVITNMFVITSIVRSTIELTPEVFDGGSVIFEHYIDDDSVTLTGRIYYKSRKGLLSIIYLKNKKSEAEYILISNGMIYRFSTHEDLFKQINQLKCSNNEATQPINLSIKSNSVIELENTSLENVEQSREKTPIKNDGLKREITLENIRDFTAITDDKIIGVGQKDPAELPKKIKSQHAAVAYGNVSLLAKKSEKKLVKRLYGSAGNKRDDVWSLKTEATQLINSIVESIGTKATGIDIMTEYLKHNSDTRSISALLVMTNKGIDPHHTIGFKALIKDGEFIGIAKLDRVQISASSWSDLRDTCVSLVDAM